MQRSRLKNIVNKSKDLQQDPFDTFKKALPEEFNYYKDDNNYRLKDAWKAYGEPKTFKEAQETGLVLGNVLASIGYNEDTGNFEYLNQGYENDNVNRDIRVWEEEMISLVKELKQGGYIRLFDHEKNHWIYSKNQPEIEKFQKGGQMNVIPEGVLHARKNNMEGAGKDFTHKGIPVMAKGGEQVAEIEKEEIIFNKKFTDYVESNLKEYEEASQKDKDEIAIQVGKRLVKEIFENTDDKTGLIDEMEAKS